MSLKYDRRRRPCFDSAFLVTPNDLASSYRYAWPDRVRVRYVPTDSVEYRVTTPRCFTRPRKLRGLTATGYRRRRLTASAIESAAARHSPLRYHSHRATAAHEWDPGIRSKCATCAARGDIERQARWFPSNTADCIHTSDQFNGLCSQTSAFVISGHAVAGLIIKDASKRCRQTRRARHFVLAARTHHWSRRCCANRFCSCIFPPERARVQPRVSFVTGA